MSERAPKMRSRVNTMRTVLYILLAVFVGVVLFRYYGSSGNGGGGGGLFGGTTNSADYTDIPEEYQMKYMPSDFKPDIDEETAVAVLSNPHRYRREFNDLVYNVNMEILQHVANRMGLADSLKNQLQGAYDEHHPYLRNLYFNDFVQLSDTTSNVYQSWYNNESSSAVEAVNEVASKYTCFLVNTVLSTLIRTYDGRIAAKGSGINTPCGLALTEGLRPLIKRMEERAAIRDFSASKGLMEERVEKAIAELATMEVTDKKGLNRQVNTKVFGIEVSKSDVEITAISTLKVGFKLNQYLDIQLDESQNTVVVTLPSPQILSHEVYPKIDNLSIGWMREVSNEDFNRNFNALREDFRRDAMESDIFTKAKEQAREVMNLMLGPVITTMNNDYQLRVQFKGGNRPDYDKEFYGEDENVNG
ncbi:MAG: DUF4230 domain-containing protein [Saprospiraceae bacterium]